MAVASLSLVAALVLLLAGVLLAETVFAGVSLSFFVTLFAGVLLAEADEALAGVDLTGAGSGEAVLASLLADFLGILDSIRIRLNVRPTFAVYE